jgi:CubicO group peptidase (beta-lactamase class C family)
VTAVAAMQLYEEGAFSLKDPVADFIPSFADVRVYRDGPASGPRTEPATRPVRLWHLFTHTAGLTYGFHHAHPVDEMYRAAGFEWVAPEGRDLASCCDLWAGLPLLFEPGAEWNYSVASDVLGRVVEVVSGQPLDRFFAERIFGPLGMADTGFWVEQADAGDLAALYMAGPGGGLARHDDLGGRALRRPACLAGGGGLVSTAADYHRFTQALLRATTCPAGPTWSRSGGGCSPRPPSTASATASASPSSSTRSPTRSSPPPASSPGAAPPAPSSGSTRPSGSPPSSSPS